MQGFEKDLLQKANGSTDAMDMEHATQELFDINALAYPTYQYILSSG